MFDVIVRLPKSGRKSDAIQVCVEHVEGYCAEVFFPYQNVNHETAYGEIFAQEGKCEIFAVSSGLGAGPLLLSVAGITTTEGCLTLRGFFEGGYRDFCEVPSSLDFGLMCPAGGPELPLRKIRT